MASDSGMIPSTRADRSTYGIGESSGTSGGTTPTTDLVTSLCASGMAGRLSSWWRRIRRRGERARPWHVPRRDVVCFESMDGRVDHHSSARSWWSRAWNGFRAEFEPLHPRLLLVDLLVRPLPQLAFQRLRTALYRGAGIAIVPGTLIAGRLDLIGPGPITSRLGIGADCWLNAPIFADLSGPIRIGDRVTIGHHVIFITANHTIWAASQRAGPVE